MQVGKTRVDSQSSLGLVASTTYIEQVYHKYLLSSQSYSDCYRNVGVIESSRMNWRTGIFVLQRWMDIVAKSSKRFMVNSMENQDFISLQSSDERYVQKVIGISIIQWLRFQKPDPDTLFYK